MKGVERGLARDIEVGATVWHRVNQDAAGFKVGGMVVDITTTPAGLRILHVLRFVNRAPTLEEFADVDVDESMVDYFSKPAADTAQRLFQWLGQQNAKQRRSALDWAERATRLAAAGMSPNFLPKANARYLAARDNQKADIA